MSQKGPQRAIGRLRDIGVRVSLDDFGIGFSSLSHLANLTIDELKLDGSLVADAVTDHRSRAIVQATVGLAQALGVDLVVEGIENEPTRELLAELDCHMAQGNLFGRPMPAGDVSRWLGRTTAAEGRPGDPTTPGRPLAPHTASQAISKESGPRTVRLRT